MNALITLDGSILVWIQNNLRNPVLDPIMIFITHLGDKGLFCIALTLLLMALPKTRRTGVTSAFAMVFGLIVANLVLKNWVARIRPYEAVEGLRCIIEKQHDFSFPSGHTTNVFACGWVVFRSMRKRYGVPMLILAILISLSRLYVGVHYPTDVLAGVVIGIAAADAAIELVRYLRGRFPAFRRFTGSPKKKARRRA